MRSLKFYVLVLCFAVVPAVGRAEDDFPPFFANVEASGVAPLTKPQTDRLHPGFLGFANVGAELGWIDIRLTGMLLELPGKKAFDGEDALVGGVGGGFRVRPPAGTLAYTPYVDLTGLCAIANNVSRFAYSLALGVNFNVVDDGRLSIGPVLRYTQIMSRNEPGYDDRDAHLLSLGVVVEFGEAAPPATGSKP